jgi:hypothetical protein
MFGVAGRKNDPSQSTERVPNTPPRVRQRLEAFLTLGEVIAGNVDVSGGVFDVPKHNLSVRDHFEVT